MTKKIKDLTLGEVVKICRKHKTCFDSKCPLYKFYRCNAPHLTRKKDLESEVEIDEKMD